MNGMDVHARSRAVAETLRSAGFEEHASAMRAAIDGASTGTELLMRVRHELRRISRRTDVYRSTHREIEEMVAQIDALLAP